MLNRQAGGLENMVDVKNAVVIYHGNCPDGWTGAWLMHRYLRRKGYDDIVLHHGSYGEPPPEVSGDVFLVDFCYEPEHLVKLVTEATTLTVLDHHQTAAHWAKEVWGANVIDTWDRDLAGIKDPVVVDQNHSGAMLAQLWSGQHHRFVKHIQDRDLWQWRFPDTNAIFLAVTSHDYTLEAWDAISEMPLVDLIDQGEAISRYQGRLIAGALDEAYQATVLGHEKIWIAGAPYAIGSDVAGELAKRDPERFAGYFVVKPDGVVRWGLRSTDSGMDVAVLAETRGGGGHKHASGFETPLAYLADAS